MKAETAQAIDAVRQTLPIARRRVGAARVFAKANRDLSTGTDLAIEATIRHVLSGATGLPVVGEEFGGLAPTDGSLYWLVDPVCGSRNLASGIGSTAINVALIEQNEVALAVVGDPARNEINFAEVGGGAWVRHGKSNRPLHVSDASGVLVLEDSRAVGRHREYAARIIADVVRADRWDLRSLGSTISLAYVASGRIAAYILWWTSAVHAAAGSLLVREAGGRVTDVDGQPWTLDSESTLAAGPALHDELLRVVEGIRRGTRD